MSSGRFTRLLHLRGHRNWLLALLSPLLCVQFTAAKCTIEALRGSICCLRFCLVIIQSSRSDRQPHVHVLNKYEFHSVAQKSLCPSFICAVLWLVSTFACYLNVVSIDTRKPSYLHFSASSMFLINANLFLRCMEHKEKWVKQVSGYVCSMDIWLSGYLWRSTPKCWG